MKRVDPAKLEVLQPETLNLKPQHSQRMPGGNSSLSVIFLQINIRRRMSKEERLALVKAGREDRGKYLARAAVKQKKVPYCSSSYHKILVPMH